MDEDFNADLDEVCYFKGDNDKYLAQEAQKLKDELVNDNESVLNDYYIMEDVPGDDNDELEYCIPVRGRPLMPRPYKRPGGNLTFGENLIETTKSIRSVTNCSFANDDIVKSLNHIQLNSQEDRPRRKVPMPNIKFNSAGSSSSSENEIRVSDSPQPQEKLKPLYDIIKSNANSRKVKPK